MENKRVNPIVHAIVLVVLIAVSFGLLTAVNNYTAPIIEANSAGAQNEALLGVMPQAVGFEQLYGGDAESQLPDVPETVQSIFRETSGQGYVILLATTKGYTGDPIEFILAVDSEGKISGVELTAYPETRDFGAEYPLTYLGQDSALADVSLVAGVTYSSSAFRGAVNDGLSVLIDNDMIAAGVKDASQLLEELLPSVYPGMANLSGILQMEDEEVAEGQYSYITRAMKSLNEAGYAYFVSDGSGSYLATVNQAGGVRLYDVEGNDVSGDAALAPLAAEASEHAAAKLGPAPGKPARKLTRLIDAEEPVFTPIALTDVYNSVTEAYLVDLDDGSVNYAFVARSYGYSNIPMAIYFVLDETGAIVAMSADELILHAEYFNSYELDEPSYKAGFQGLTADSYTEDVAFISGATFTTESVHVAARDVFETFEILSANGGVN